ncbi:MAG: DUF5711 family protein [Oscillospiraceae bacterium]|nr:DUF5711 family protein [Oscillospiraceae bacterium]
MTAQQEKIVPIDARRMRRARRRPLRMALYVLFFVAVLGGIVLFVTYRGNLSAGTFADLFSRIRFTMSQADEQIAEEFPYDDYLLTRFSPFQGGLALLSGDRLEIFAPSGRAQYGVSCQFANPALAVSDRTVLAYDRGGVSYLLADNGATLLKSDWDGAIYSACMNPKGFFAFISDARGYASTVTVFDDHQSEIYKWYFQRQYALDVSLSPSGALLALVSGGQEDSRFVGRVTLLNTAREEPVAVRDLPDVLPVGVGFLTEKLFYVVTEESASFYNETGELLFDWPFGNRRLLRYGASEDGYLVLSLEDGRSDASELIVLDPGGARAQLPLLGHLDSLSVSGSWVGALADGQAHIYSAALTEKGDPRAAPGVLALLMRADGSALLLGREGLSVFRP